MAIKMYERTTIQNGNAGTPKPANGRDANHSTTPMMYPSKRYAPYATGSASVWLKNPTAPERKTRSMVSGTTGRTSTFTTIAMTDNSPME